MWCYASGSGEGGRDKQVRRDCKATRATSRYRREREEGKGKKGKKKRKKDEVGAEKRRAEKLVEKGGRRENDSTPTDRGQSQVIPVVLRTYSETR
jgi:hypothetical protein